MATYRGQRKEGHCREVAVMEMECHITPVYWKGKTVFFSESNRTETNHKSVWYESRLVTLQLTCWQAIFKLGGGGGGVTRATSHGSLIYDTCHTRFSVENKSNYLHSVPTMNQDAGGRGQTKSKGNKGMQSKRKTMHPQGNHLLADSRSPG